MLVVFDGLDELFDGKDRETVTHQITGFAARYPGARVLVTSRHVGYQRGAFDTAGFGHYMLQDLDREQIAVFAQRWYRIACPGSAADAGRLKDRLLAAIDGTRAVRDLAGNPLLLTILAVIGRRRELPRDRCSVYEHAVTVLAVLIANATKLGLVKMAEACGVPYDVLAWTQEWYVREETLREANTVIVNHHHRLDLARVFGGGTMSSSDGQRFPVRGKSLTARAMNIHFADQGLST